MGGVARALHDGVLRSRICPSPRRERGAGPERSLLHRSRPGLGLHVVYGFPEHLPAGVSDSANLVGLGGVLLTYRKRHLVRTTGEDRVFVPGTELPVVEVGGTRVALVVCWDLGFPQTVREAASADGVLSLGEIDPGLPERWRRSYGSTICEEDAITVPQRTHPETCPTSEGFGAAHSRVMVG